MTNLRLVSRFTSLSSVLTTIAVVLAAASGTAQETPETSQAPVLSPPIVEAEVHHDSSPPLWLIPPAPRPTELREHVPGRLPRPLATSPQVDPVIQEAGPLDLVPPPSLNFDGVGNGFTGPAGTFTVNSAPPDTNGDVGPNHYVQIVNTDFAVFNKSGTAIFGPVPINTLWSTFGGGCQANNDGDPVVIYDPIADRFVISQFSVTTTPYLQCVAVSQTADPTGAYWRYSFTYTDFPDYPKMSVWPDAYYETFNMFAGVNFNGGQVCAYDRTKMLAGLPATQQCFNVGTSFGGLLVGDLDGARQPPAGSPAYVLALGTGINDLRFWKFHVDWATPANTTLTGPTVLTVAAYNAACNAGTCIPQGGTTQQLDSLADRLMFRLAYRNFGDHEALVVNHSVTAGSSTGVRWYEIRSPATTPTIFQQGTYAPDSNFRWMGSIAMDQSGNMALGFSVSGSAIHPEIHYTGRLVGDALGTMTQGEGTLIDGLGSQTGPNGLKRWGDYSMMAVDPSDDCTFWYTTEYIPSNGEFNWKTRFGTFKFPGCGGAVVDDFSISASPSSLTLTQGNSGTSTISTAVTSGNTQTVNLSVSGVPTGATAGLNPTSITSGGSSTLTVNAGTAAPGTYPLIVTGTGTSATHTTTVTLTVPANDFSISANPTSLTLTQGNSGTSTISTAVTSGNAQTINLSVSGVPNGATAGLNPTSITSGGSSTLTVNAGTAAPGTYPLTVTGTGTSATHSTNVSLTVRAPVTNDFSISASPSSLTVAQRHSGTSTISTAVTSGSAQRVDLTVTGVPSGATATLNPTFVTAGGSSTLTVHAGTAAPGTYPLTVTGTGPSATHRTTVTLTVPRNDFSISASPSRVSVARGSAARYTVRTAIVSGRAQRVVFSVSGLPAGATATFNPTSVTTGASSTLRVTTSSTTPTGDHTLTITGTAGSGSHTAHVVLNVR